MQQRMSETRPIDANLLREFPLPAHDGGADKEDRGRALFIAGSRETAGAALLAGMGALRAGAGKLQIATAESIAPGIAVAMPEARVIAFAEDAVGCIDRQAIAALVRRCADIQSLTVGPGLQRGDALAGLIGAILDSGRAYPLILDAAAFKVLPGFADELRGWPGGAALLPHATEMARLLECEAEDVQADPLAAAHEAARRFGAVALVKGEWSVIAAPDGRSFRFHGYCIGLATSGSGDVLAGIVGGLAARGADPLTAILWGVFLHGEAGRALSERVGRIGFIAREIPDLVPELMERLRPS